MHGIEYLNVRFQERLLSWQEPGDGVDVSPCRCRLVKLNEDLVIDKRTRRIFRGVVKPYEVQ